MLYTKLYMKKIAAVILLLLSAFAFSQDQFYITRGENFLAFIRLYPEVFTGDSIIGFNEYDSDSEAALEQIPLKITEYTFTGADGDGSIHFNNTEYDYVRGDTNEQEIVFNSNSMPITIRNPVGGPNIKLNIEENGGVLNVTLVNVDDFEIASE